jgi:hypothetical protein
MALLTLAGLFAACTFLFNDRENCVVWESDDPSSVLFEPLHGQVSNGTDKLGSQSESEPTPRLAVLNSRAQPLNGNLLNFRLSLPGLAPVAAIKPSVTHEY